MAGTFDHQQRRSASRVTRTVAKLAPAVALAMALGCPAAPAAGAANAGPRRPGRVLVLSLPGVTWQDVDRSVTPNLKRVLDKSAVANLNTRTAMGPARVDDGYATLGAGTRSATDRSTAGEAFDPGEQFGTDTATNVFRRRTGRSVRDGLLFLGLEQLDAANRSRPYDAHIGALGDTLARAGFERAVIANADGAEPDTTPVPGYRRDAVLSMMGSDGTVPAGSVGSGLLQPDPGAPFGVRLAPATVEQEFARVWRSRSVVLVEGSDLVRADQYGTFATSTARRTQLSQALRRTDAMVGALLAHVDFSRDAVLVVGPSHPSADNSLTLAALRAPGTRPGLLRSSTTRRSGFVAVVDVAPTILDLLGVDPPSSMEGRPFTVGREGGSAADRQSFLVSTNRDGLFRDGLVDTVTLSYIVAMIALALAIAAFARVERARPWLRRGALLTTGFLMGTYLVGPLHFAAHGGEVAYWSFVVGVGIVVAAVCEIAARRAPVDPLILALGGLVLLHVGDTFTGAHLEFNSVFGYSPTVGIRFAGIGNTSFAQVTAAAIVLVALLAWRIGGRRGLRVGLAILAIVFLSLTPPLWGQDFGGTLATAPAFLLFGWLLTGRRVRARGIAVLAGVLVGAGLLVGFLDLLRPSNQRTHVGRFFEQVGNNGWSGFATVIARKGSENLSTISDTAWLVLIVAVLAVTAYLRFGPGRPLQTVLERVPTLLPAAVVFAVAAALGYALNDSGVSVPGMMIGVAGGVVVYLCAGGAEPATPRGRGAGAARPTGGTSGEDTRPERPIRPVATAPPG